MKYLILSFFLIGCATAPKPSLNAPVAPPSPLIYKEEPSAFYDYKETSSILPESQINRESEVESSETDMCPLDDIMLLMEHPPKAMIAFKEFYDLNLYANSLIHDLMKKRIELQGQEITQEAFDLADKQKSELLLSAYNLAKAKVEYYNDVRKMTSETYPYCRKRLEKILTSSDFTDKTAGKRCDWVQQSGFIEDPFLVNGEIRLGVVLESEIRGRFEYISSLLIKLQKNEITMEAFKKEYDETLADYPDMLARAKDSYSQIQRVYSMTLNLRNQCLESP